jgi:hypothetical protein
MKALLKLTLMLLVAGCFSWQPVYGQGSLIRKLKEKAENKAVEQIFGPDQKESSGSGNETQGNSGYGSSNDANRPANTKSSGLTTQAPDVLANIDQADAAFGNKKYGDARFGLRQAILGIEMEIGEKILEGLPESINGLPAIKEQDNVMSSGIGFVGLMIERTYRKDDKQFKVTVGNEAAMLSAANFYLSSGGMYATSTDDNHKVVTIDGKRAVLEYDEYSGYKLSVPFGQSSILVTEGTNYADENEMMDSSKEINIENIKKELGEQ